MPHSCHIETAALLPFSFVGRSRWGSVRKLPSGKYRARYSVDGTWHRAETAFRTKREADAYLASVRVDLDRGTWIDPDAGKATFEEYAERWLVERPQLRPRTRSSTRVSCACTSTRCSVAWSSGRSHRAGSARGAPA